MLESLVRVSALELLSRGRKVSAEVISRHLRDLVEISAADIEPELEKMLIQPETLEESKKAA